MSVPDIPNSGQSGAFLKGRGSLQDAGLAPVPS